MTDEEIVARAIGKDDPGDEWRMWLDEARAVVAALREAGRIGPRRVYARDLHDDPWWSDFFAAVLRVCDAAPTSVDEDWVRRALAPKP